MNILSVSVSVVETVSVQIRGENVYTIEYQEIQYFMFIEDKEATISCTVKGTTVTPNTSFKKVSVNADQKLFVRESFIFH